MAMNSRRRAIQSASIAFVCILLVAVAAISVFELSAPTNNTGTKSTELTNSISSNTGSECAPSPGHTGTSSYTVTETGWPGCDCALVASNSQGMLYVSTNASVGDDVCLAASLYNSSTVGFTITNSTGSVVLETAACIALGAPGSPSPSGDSCESDWNTADPGQSGGAAKVGTGPITAGTYTLVATDGDGSPAVLEANFTLAPSSSSSVSGSTTIQSTGNSTTVQQYPLVWGPNPVSECDTFCIVATLGFVGTASISDTSTTTVTGSNGTTTIISSTTTIVRTSPYPQTTVIVPSGYSSYSVEVTASVQDAATGQNIASNGSPATLSSSCDILPTGLTNCIATGHPDNMPASYANGKSQNFIVTVYITKLGEVPCGLQVPGYSCTTQLLAPPSPPFTITDW